MSSCLCFRNVFPSKSKKSEVEDEQNSPSPDPKNTEANMTTQTATASQKVWYLTTQSRRHEGMQLGIEDPLRNVGMDSFKLANFSIIFLFH